MKHINIPIFIPQLGCPYQCIFCNQKKISAQSSVPDAKQVREQIGRYIEKMGAKTKDAEIAFFGGSFTCLPQELQKEYLEAAQAFLRQPLVTGIRISTRPDYIDEPKLDFLKINGVTVVELGVQSFSDPVLQASGRLYSCGQVIAACQLIKSKGFQLGVQVMPGLPEDNYESALQTAEVIAGLKPDMVRIYPTLVIKDTPLEQLYYRRLYQPLTLSEAVKTCADMKEIISRENIKIIRMGLQPNEEMLNGEVVAGPFHPAFGELVEQMVFFRQAQRLLEGFISTGKQREPLVLIVNPKEVSKMIGHKRVNIELLSHIWKAPIIVKGQKNQTKGKIELQALKAEKNEGCL